MNRYIIAIASIIISIGCSKTEYERSTAYVYKTRNYHWGHGYFRQQVYYKYSYNGDTIKGSFKSHLTYPQPKFAEVGDSVIVEYPLGRPRKCKAIILKKQNPTIEQQS